MKKKVAVAMSGGVDSSLVAAILLQKNFEVIGVTMLLFGNENQDFIADAKKVADCLGIKHYVADFRKTFRAEVEDYFVAEYLQGKTPNPCVRCNCKIKFGKLFDFAMELGADFLATGHYAQIVFEDNRFKLKKAADIFKDQSYVLYNLTPEKLAKIILPLGTFSKSDTRNLAEKFNLPVAKKPDSQEICFVPEDDYKKYLLERADKKSAALQPGEIINTESKILGKHNGAAFYTIGQRKGLGIANPTPLYVLQLDAANKKVIVGSNAELFSDTLTAENVNWIYQPELPAKLQAKIRYGNKIFDCEVSEENNLLRVKFSESVRAITAGQSVVFYDGDELLGGGLIKK